MRAKLRAYTIGAKLRTGAAGAAGAFRFLLRDRRIHRSMFPISCLALALALPSATAAQLAPEASTGSRVPIKPVQVGQSQAGIIRKRFAQCMYRSARPKAIALLEHSDPVAVDLKNAKVGDLDDAFNMSSCLSDAMDGGQTEIGTKFGRALLRDMLAEEAYLEANAVVPPPPADTSLPAHTIYVAEGEERARAVALLAFADCTITRDLNHSDALLRTLPASPAERAAAFALSPAFSACLTQGQELTLTPRGIRAFVAFAMWNRFARQKTAGTQ